MALYADKKIMAIRHVDQNIWQENEKFLKKYLKKVNQGFFENVEF